MSLHNHRPVSRPTERDGEGEGALGPVHNQSTRSRELQHAKLSNSPHIVYITHKSLTSNRVVYLNEIKRERESEGGPSR